VCWWRFVVAVHCWYDYCRWSGVEGLAVVIELVFVERLFGANTPCVWGVTRVTLTNA